MARVDNTFEGGTNTTTISTGNSGGASGTAFSSVSIGSGNTATYSTVNPLDGLVSGLFDVATAANADYVQHTIAQNATGSISFLMRLNTLPSATLQFPIAIRGNSGGTALARIQMNLNGQIQCVCGAGSNTNTTAAVPTGVTCRWELRWAGFNSANSAISCNVYNWQTGALLVSSALTGQTTAFLPDRVIYGKFAATGTVNFTLDRLRSDDGATSEIGIDVPTTVWPNTTFDTDIELNINNVWTNVTRLNNGEAGVYGGERADITVTRGRNDEYREFDPASCSFQLNNRDGRFSPRNPMSPYYGYLSRNTPVRISLPSQTSYMTLGGGTIAAASAPDSAALSITGDIDLRINADMDSWYTDDELISKWAVAAGQRSYMLVTQADGTLEYFWSANGTTILSTSSTSPLPIASGRLSVRVTHDVNNGASGNTVAFYYSYDTNLSTASWTQLGTSVVNSGTTSIFNGTSLVYVGKSPDSSTNADSSWSRFYSAEIRDGIAGTVAANPNFSTQAANAGVFLDTATTVTAWTLSGTALINNRDYRFYGEISEWPLEWDTTGNDVWADITAAGVTRRLAQGDAAGSALYRGTTALSSLVAYWPGEDDQDSTFVSSAAPNGRNMTSGAVRFTTFSDYAGFKCSEPIFKIGDNAFSGGVVPYTSTGEIQLQFLLRVEDGDIANDLCFMRLFCGGTVSRWDLVTDVDGNVTIQAYSGVDDIILNDGPYSIFDIEGEDHMVVFALAQNGSDVAYKLSMYRIGEGVITTGTQTLSSRTITAATGIHLNPPGSAGLTESYFGHIGILKDVDIWATPLLQLDGYNGETAGVRIKRICQEEGISIQVLGSAGNTTQLGYQTSDTILNILKGAAEADTGFLLESTDFNGLQYRTRRSLYNQPAKLTIDYAAHEMTALKYNDSDSTLKNDVTVTRNEGGSDRQVLESGSLSVLAPPLGVGRYDDNKTVSLYADEDTPNQASWRLHMGTVDEPRFTIELDLGQEAYRTDTALFYAVRGLRVGDRIDVLNPPAWLPPETLRLTVQGITENIHNFTHKFVIATQPYEPFDVGSYSGSRYSATGTVTAEALDTTETAVDITCPSATEYWSTGDGSFDIMVGGERMTVTSISGTGISQTMTVTRSVNGIVKEHASGTAVNLFRPAYWAL